MFERSAELLKIIIILIRSDWLSGALA
jgi:hypothetical protein